MRWFWQKQEKGEEQRAEPAEPPRAATSPPPGPEPAPARSAHSADGPIDDPADDLLGREPFARGLAEDVRLAPRESGFVIGLTGEWGEGKTSVLQLVAGELRGELAAVVSFNPWLFSGTEQLVTYFFAELASQLRETSSERLGKVANALAAYGRVVSPLRYVPYVGELFRASGEAASDLSGALDRQGPSASEQAKLLREQLAGLERPILVLVDDLDRLRPEEIVDVVRLVRLVGDFPNLVYLLAFDRDVVEDALDGGATGRGHAYLEKIIHISHVLPPVRPEDLTAVLAAALAEAIPDPGDYRSDAERFDELFWTQVRPLFNTVRDVRRFVNLLRTTLELIGEEVDLADLLALEALRLFEPKAFEQIVSARYPLTGTIPPLQGTALARLFATKDDAGEREQLQRIPAAAASPERVEEILTQLFPHAERHFDGGLRGTRETSGLRAARRVGDGEVFDVYLHRRLAPGALPSREVEEFLSLFGERDALAHRLQAAEDEDVRQLYARLADYGDQFPPAGCGPALEAVMHRGVGFSDRFGDTWGSLLLRRLLDAVPSADLSSLLRKLDYPNLTRRYELVRAVEYRNRSGAAMVSSSDAEALTAELLDQVFGASATELALESDLGPLIGLAARNDLVRLRAQLPLWLPDDQFFVGFLAGHAMSKVVGRGDRSVQLNWRTLAELVPVEGLAPRLREIDPCWVEREFDDDTWVLWQQALRYVKDPKAAEADLHGWPITRVRDSD